jgi:hypothetical protein
MARDQGWSSNGSSIRTVVIDHLVLLRTYLGTFGNTLLLVEWQSNVLNMQYAQTVVLVPRQIISLILRCRKKQGM